MAEAVLFNIAKEIITKLASDAWQKIGLWWGVKDELEKLRRTVSTIMAVLLHAEEQSLESVQLQNWLGMLKEIIYDTDDLLDEFSTEALRQQVMTGNRMTKKVCLFFSHSNQFAYGLKLAHKIKDIRKRLDEIAACRKFYLEERYEEKLITPNYRDQDHCSPPEVVVGRERDKEAIIELLLSSNVENVSIIAIVGIGGLGKTTLAQIVYNDEKIKMHFELRIWACVSYCFDVKLIVEKMIESATCEKPRNSEMDALKNLLHQQINGKKFLIVLDDIWNEDPEKWSRLKELLVGGAEGSKIIITTRQRKVAELTCSIFVHELKGLSKIESLSLFKKIALRRVQVPSPRHEAVGEEVVKRCSGVPLAIKIIGGLLCYKDSESEWLSFIDKELQKVNDSNILQTLKLSYNHLPSHLKHCFAYCSLFPKDYIIEVEFLIHLWVAQGYVVSSEPNQCLGEIGIEYFTDLLWRSFFHEVKKDEFGNYKTCKMHDLMHDLAMLVAREDCALLSNFDLALSNEKARHASFQLDWRRQYQVSPSMCKAKKLRTFLLLGDRQPHIREEIWHEMFSNNLRCLRVLDLHDLKIVTLPSSIHKLKHLRYLDLSHKFSRTSIKKVPDSITKLQNLQVLKLNKCRELTQLPRDMKKLVNLTHLDNYKCDALTHMPRGIGQLTSLEKLSEFVVAKDDSFSKLGARLSELRGLNKLRGKMEIKNLERVENAAVECKAANLKEKRDLQELSLMWDYPFANNSASGNEVENDDRALEALEPHQYLKGLIVKGYRGVNLPSWFSSLTNVVSIGFASCKNIKRLPPFDQLPSLKHLRIYRLSNLEYIDVEVNSSEGKFFPSLEELQLTRCPNLKGWNHENPQLLQFPSLTTLVIVGCSKLTLMPHSDIMRSASSTAESLERMLKATTLKSESRSSSSLNIPIRHLLPEWTHSIVLVVSLCFFFLFIMIIFLVL